MEEKKSTRSGDLSRMFSINKIAEAIRKAGEEMQLHEAAEFGGESSEAFREGLVREYNAGMTRCPKCGGELVRTEDGKGDCRSCKTVFEFPREDAHLCYVNEEAVAKFVGNRIGKGFARRSGEYYHLGEVNGRTLYYGTIPPKSFYSAHKGDNVAVVLGRNSAEVPETWTGHAAYFSELFYVSEASGNIRESGNILDGLLPKGKGTKSIAHGHSRQTHKRRNDWLMFIANLLANPYREEDFFRGCLKPQVARDWFVENVHGAPKDVKQYQRDLRAFRHLASDKGKSDQREEFIILLLRTAAQPRSLEERRRIARCLPYLVMYLQDAAKKNPGRPVNITRSAWQYCRDNTKELVPVADIDDFFDKVDERLAQSA